MLMKKLSEDHYIVVDDSDIKIGDVVAERLLTGKYELFTIQTLNDIDEQTQIKITHSTQPESFGTGWMKSIQPLFLSEVKELLGVVDVEKKALEINPVELDEDWDKNKQYRDEWISGYNQALEDNKEKKYTEEDLRKAISETRRGMLFLDKYVNEFIQSLQPKTEWKVEFVDEKLRLK